MYTKQEKVNPLGGHCLPLIIQMPIFLALYYMLMGSVELRHAPFILWIQDLSSKIRTISRHYNGVTMFIIQKLSPTAVTDPMQQKNYDLLCWLYLPYSSCGFPIRSGSSLYRQ